MSGPWLGFDTTSETLSVAVADGSGRLLAEINRRAPRLHASLLLPAVSDVLALAGVARGDIDTIVANRGPGSYTGIRIGLAAMQALARGLGRPAHGVPGFLAAAHAAGPSVLSAPLVDARRGDVFSALYETGEDASSLPREILPPALRPLTAFLEEAGRLRRTVRVSGDAVFIQRDVIALFPFAAPGPTELRALDLIRFAQTAIRRKEMLDALSGTALYLRP